MMKLFIIPFVIYSAIAFLLIGCENAIEEVELEYQIFEIDQDGIINSIESDSTEVFFSGGNQWLSGWIYKFYPRTEDLFHIYQDANQLNALEVNKNSLLTAGLSHRMMRIDLDGNLLRSYYVFEGKTITDIVSSEDKVFYTTADNGIQTGSIRSLSGELRGEKILFESEQGLQDVHLSQNDHLFAAGYGIIVKCPIAENCLRGLKDSEHFRAILELDNKQILAFTHHGQIFISRDQGKDWSRIGKQIREFKREGLIDAIAIDENTYWVCGYSGLVYFTKDGGERWTKVNNLPQKDWHAIHFFNGYIYLGGTDGVFVQIKL